MFFGVQDQAELLEQFDLADVLFLLDRGNFGLLLFNDLRLLSQVATKFVDDLILLCDELLHLLSKNLARIFDFLALKFTLKRKNISALAPGFGLDCLGLEIKLERRWHHLQVRV